MNARVPLHRSDPNETGDTTLRHSESIQVALYQSFSCFSSECADALSLVSIWSL